MSQQLPYMTAADLDICEDEKAALIRVKHMLETDTLHYKRNWSSPGSPFDFNMDTPEARVGCNTVRCIGGWVASLLDIDVKAYVGRARLRRTSPLYFPNAENNYARPHIIYSSITADQAALAIHNFLTFGQPRWSDILNPEDNYLL